MIIELRTYRLKPGSLASVEARYAAAMPARLRFSPLGGFWRTEIGPLHQIIHAWPYRDLGERARVRMESVKDGTWPPPVVEFLHEQETSILIPAPFSPPLTERKFGRIYEFITDTYAPGTIRKILPVWAEKIEMRAKLSPLVACWHSELGAMNKLIHVWGYADIADWQRVKNEEVKSGAWPIAVPVDFMPLKQDSVLAVPLSFSPLS